MDRETKLLVLDELLDGYADLLRSVKSDKKDMLDFAAGDGEYVEGYASAMEWVERNIRVKMYKLAHDKFRLGAYPTSTEAKLSEVDGRRGCSAYE